MNPTPLLQTIGNLSVGLAALVLLFPLPRLLAAYASKFPSDDRWVMPALFVLIPLWLPLLVALLCMTASGGFDWLRVGRPALHALTVAAGLALGGATFVFLALYIRPGFTPRFLYTPGIYLVPLTTALLVVLSLNPRLASAFPLPWLRLPWTLFTALSLVLCVGFLGHRLVSTGLGGLGFFVRQVLSARQNAPAQLTKIPTLDPHSEVGFAELLGLAGVHHDRQTRAAATARLRELPDFTTRLATILATDRGNANSAALAFLEAATLTPDEQQRLALPARTALENFISGIPAPNYMTRERQKQLLQWGRKTIPVIVGKFHGTDVDFSPILPAFEHALRADDSRR